MNSPHKRKGISSKAETEKTKQKRVHHKNDLLSKYFLEEDFKIKFGAAFRSQRSFCKKGAVIHTVPFKCCVIPNFISDEDILSRLETELLALKFFKKSNDLYKFHQSDDLKKSSKSHIALFRDALYRDFRLWLQEITGYSDLTDQVDMSCAKYEHTDVLLCHDDELEGRRIAYIFYLVPKDWTANDGGTLDLFCTDEHGQPDQITRSLLPQWNSLVFFEVTPTSYHQVSEVLSLNKTRLSISGWFHGDNIDRPEPYQEPHPKAETPCDLEDEVLLEWINVMYLDQGVVKDIRTRFKDDSEIQLQEFLKEKRYQEVLEALGDKSIEWTWKGPANKRHFKEADLKSVPAIVQQLAKVMQSQPMFKFLRTLTGLELAAVPLSDEDESSDEDDDKGKNSNTEKKYVPCCHGRIRHWSHGCYTLVHDTDPEGAEFALDVIIYIGGKGWKSDYGGYTTYLTSGEDEELLTVHPQENSLALVYRDKETVRFVKHVNHSSHFDQGISDRDNDFCDFCFIYFE
ncbi:prolyl 3-hydroxylase OGFOD1-like isoform X1 [Acropora millepora]|uniref:prolyl 3-hydroxylase OGFOD1-like isoform X1 n=1 Tax=Acropora millepora TaxID=45264 RepID=UPI001CF1D828|nr:prolyl 3-hydroxylase OGFOD1-like isoform X1 [Acropora millepora]